MNKNNTCQNRREAIAALVLGELEAEAVEETKKHINSCQVCRSLYEALLAEEETIQSTFQAIDDRNRTIENNFVAQLNKSSDNSFSGVAASIYYLKATGSNQELAGVAWVVYSVLVLCIAGFINGLSFKERASLIKECYETLNGFYHKAKSKSVHEDSLTAEYDQVLGLCENHTECDYFKALCQEYVTNPNPRDPITGLDRWPTWYHCLIIGWSITKRMMMLLFFYSLPLVLFVGLEILA